MNYFAKTIQIFLPNGSPRGLKIAEITSRVVKAILIPRNQLEEAGKREEAKSVGVYFLFGFDEDDAKPRVYIGEAENCYERLKQHNKNKDFWDTAVVIVTNNNFFTKAHVKYLEAFCFDKIKEINRYRLEQIIPTKSYIPETAEADVMDIFETMKILLTTLGYPVFENVRERKKVVEVSEPIEEVYYCKGKGIEAKGEYTDEGFVVLEGSEIVSETVNSLSASYKRVRESLIQDNVIFQNGERYIFASDYLFNSPSSASAIILGRPSNGWVDWKDKEGKTLSENKRS